MGREVAGLRLRCGVEAGCDARMRRTLRVGRGRYCIDLRRREWKGRGEWAGALEGVWKNVRSGIERRSREELELEGRMLARDLGWVVCAVQLGEDALSDGSDVAGEICSRWMAQRGEIKLLAGRSHMC